MTMTRETKVGVVVCLSFLCLVGIVLGTKLRGDPTDEDELALKEETIPDPEPVSPADASTPPMRIPGRTVDHDSPPVIQAGAVQDAQPLSFPPPPSSVSQDGNRSVESAGPVFEAAPPATKSDTSSPVSATVTGIPTDENFVAELSEARDGPRPVVTRANVAALSLWGALSTPLASGSLSAASEPDPTAANQSGPGDVEPPNRAAAEIKDGGLPPGPAATDKQPLGPASALVRGANPTDELPNGPKPAKAGDITLSMDPPRAAGTKPSAELLPPMPPPAAPRADASAERATANPTALPSGPDQPSSPGQGQPVVQVSASDAPRRVGEAPTATTPPIPVPGPGSAQPTRSAASTNPQVESYDEEIYRIKGGDTFDRISTAHFNTDKYAKALERWNASHPQASDNLRASPPVLEAGQLVFVPPAYMLEKRYGSLVPGYKPQVQQPSSDPQRTANASPRGEPAGNATPNYKWYVVSPEGQMIRDIARATLNDPERWKDISKLNPERNPAYPVPGLTSIKVPTDARIPAANLPQTASR